MGGINITKDTGDDHSLHAPIKVQNDDKYHHDDLKSELIEKGLKLLDEEGYEGFSMRKLAKSCNVSHAATYRHFKSKDDLITAIFYEEMSAFSHCLQSAVDLYPNDTKKQIKSMGCAYIKFFVEKPECLRVTFLSDIQKRMAKQNDGIESDKYAQSETDVEKPCINEERDIEDSCTCKKADAEDSYTLKKADAEDPYTLKKADIEDPYMILYKTIEKYHKELEQTGLQTMDLNAYLLYCWGLVHGISILLTRNEFFCEENYLTLIEQIIWNDALFN